MRRIAPLLLAVAACARPAPPPAPPAPAAPVESVAPAPTAAAQLDGLDGRKPVPLLPMMADHQKQNMRGHLEAVQGIVAALAANDFAGVERAAQRIGFSEQMGMMCTHMGAAAPGFTEQALAFHHTADRIVAAARAKDRARVLVELGATLQTCTTCHATWKQRPVDAATWQKLAQMPAPMGPMPMPN